MATTQHSEPPEPLQRPFERPEPEVLRELWDRLHVENRHFMLAFVGEEGSGKSLTAGRVAAEIDKNFNAQKVHFEPDTFLELLRDEQYEPGDVYVLDEAGVSLGVRTWHDEAQIMVNKAFQLIRSHNIGVIFTLPRLGELDSQTQGRLQAFYEITSRVDEEYVRGKWKFIDPDRTGSGQDYKKYPRVRRNGQKQRVRSVAFKPPTGDWVEEYHWRKNAHQKETYDDAISAIREESEDDSDDGKSAGDIAEEVLDGMVKEFISKHGQTGRKYVDKDLLRAEFGISHSEANAAKKMIERECDQIE